MPDEPTIEARFEVLRPQHTAAARIREPMSTVDIGALFGDVMERLAGRLGEAGTTSAGPPYARYHAWDGDIADVEIGVPLAGPVAGLPDLASLPPGEIGASELPGGRVALAVHRGPYPTLGETYGSLHDWIHAQGFDEGEAPWESYIDNPYEVADAAELRTEILWPVPDR